MQVLGLLLEFSRVRIKAVQLYTICRLMKRVLQAEFLSEGAAISCHHFSGSATIRVAGKGCDTGRFVADEFLRSPDRVDADAV